MSDMNEMMMQQQGMPPQGAGPAQQPQAPMQGQGQPGGGLELGPMGPERMVPGAMMIVELNGIFFLVPSIDEQGQQMDEAMAVEHLKQTGLFFAASMDPQALVAYAEQGMAQNQGGMRQQPQPEQMQAAQEPMEFSPF